MECPVCKDKCHVEIDTHSDGYAQNIQECGSCGTVWTNKEQKEIVLHNRRPQAI